MATDFQYTDDIRVIRQIQFGILSPEKIRAQSVCEINRPISRQNDLHGTPLDPRLGANHLMSVNPLTNLNMGQDPGNFGHHFLAKPCYNITFMPYIVKCLKIICCECASLLVDKQDSSLLRRILARKGYNRLNYINQSVNQRPKGKNICPSCDVIQPRYKLTKRNILEIIREQEEEKIPINPEYVLQIFQKISAEDCNLAGFNANYSHPSWMIWTVLPIAPYPIRPAVEAEMGKYSDDDLTHKINDIIKCSNQLSQRLSTDASPSSNAVKTIWDTLQYHVATLIDNESNLVPTALHRNNTPLITLFQRYKGKGGRFRSNLMGKRCNDSARSVITGDPNISISQVGVPLKVATRLTFEETVNQWNLPFLQKLVHAGPDEYPGAKHYKSSKSKYRIDLGVVDRSQIILNYGDKVYRYMMDGDVVLFNRQPSLHKMSIMAHRAKILKTGNSFRLNVNVTPPYNADFDGDEMNLHLPQTHQSALEVQMLASVPTQIVSPQSSKPVIGLVQDNLVGLYRLSNEYLRNRPHDYIGLKDFMRYISWMNNYTGKTVQPITMNKEQGPIWTARQLVGSMLPTISLKKGNVKVKHGKLLENFPPIAKLTVIMGGYQNINNEKKGKECKIDYSDQPTEPDSIVRRINQSCQTNDIPLTFSYQKDKNKMTVLNQSNESIYIVTQGYRNIIPYLGFRNPIHVSQNIKPNELRMANKEFQLDEPPTFDKGIVGKSATNGLFHLTWLDKGPEETKDLIDNISRLTTQWLLMDGFSIGFSDMNISKEAHQIIQQYKDEYKKIIQHLISALRRGTYIMERNKYPQFAPMFYQSIPKQFEMDMQYLLGELKNKVQQETVQNLSRSNRMLAMAKSGSKGSSGNAVQIISMLGQQEIEGGRVQDMLNRRPLPHFPKDTVDPRARGYIDRSFMQGLDPMSYWSHTMAGRMGVISTSIKTAETGYLQRKLIKVLEDLVVSYGYSVRNASGTIIQYLYGGDGFDASKLQIENVDFLQLSDLEFMEQMMISTHDPLSLWMSSEAYQRYQENQEEEIKQMEDELEKVVSIRNELRQIYYRGHYPEKIYSPVHFQRLQNNVIFKMGMEDQPNCELLPSEIITMRNSVIDRLPNIDSNPMFRSLFLMNITPKKIIQKRFTKDSLSYLLHEVETMYRNALASPGDAVGVIAAQSIGEPSTQMTLDTFHHTGDGAKANVARGVPRIIEIVSLNAKQKTPSISVFLNRRYMLHDILAKTDLWTMEQNLLQQTEQESEQQVSKIKSQMIEKVSQIQAELEYIRFRDLVKSSHIMYDQNNTNTVLHDDMEFLDKYIQFLGENDSTRCIMNEHHWTIRFELDKDKLGQQEIYMYQMEKIFQQHLSEHFTCIFSDDYQDHIVCRFVISNDKKDDDIDIRNQLEFYEKLIMDVNIKGISGIKKCRTRQIKRDYLSPNGALIPVTSAKFSMIEKKSIQTMDYVIDTDGSNLLEVLNHPYVDQVRTISNNIHEVYELFGIEAARQLIIDEINDVMKFAGSEVNTRHIKMLADIMTHRGKLISVDRHGMGKGDSGPLARASFEETTTHMSRAGAFGERDNMKGVSANAMFGQFVPTGTGSVEIHLDEDILLQSSDTLSKHQEKGSVELPKPQILSV